MSSEDQPNKLRILLGGSYHAGNLGDLALLDTYLKRLREEYPTAKITVFSYDPEFIKKHYG